MIDIIYYGAVEKYKTAEQLVVQYRFVVNNRPIPVHLVLYIESSNGVRYSDLLNEASNYAYAMYLLGQYGRGE